MSVIKLTNNVMVSRDNLELHGIDTSNVIATNVGRNANYTATQDCWMLTWCNANAGWYIGIDGVETLVYSNYNSDLTPLVKGQVFKVRGGSDVSKLTTTVYGVK